MTTYIEAIVNVPIRRSFRRPPILPVDDSNDGDSAVLQTFHYHLPPELEATVVPGHLIWVPFGVQEIQAVVLRRTGKAPVATKAVLRLSRPEPVLMAYQLELAAWIAETYVAPFSEAIRLFLPPGILTKQAEKPGVAVRRELRITLQVAPSTARARLLELGRETGQARVLAWLIARGGSPAPLDEVMAACNLRSSEAVKMLAARAIVADEDRQVRLLLDEEEAHNTLLLLRGAHKYVPVIDVLAAAGRALWRYELYAAIPLANASILRDLERAGLIELREEIFERNPLSGRTYLATQPPTFTPEQTAVWERIYRTGFAQNTVQEFLLHGVTGSGKTEIYLSAIAETLAQGRQAIVLVPEIALTPQTVARFAGRFPDRVTLIHSQLSQGERYDVWRAIRAGRSDVVIGPRSALFAPLPRLGLIVLDEEHEPTYKQSAEEWGSYTVFYDARAVARKLADLTRSVLIFGSATPSLETYLAAERGELMLLEMPRRVMGHRMTAAGQEVEYAQLPPVEVVDMRQELRAGNRSIFSRSLSSQLMITLDAHEQAILFLNRRGTNTFVMCRDCGHVEECPRCKVPLTYHEAMARLICHHCNRAHPVPLQCPACSGKRIRFFGAGTERLEEAVKEILPQARVLRWDADTTERKGSHEAIMAAFVAHEADILIGTQMIAKGLDLPLVTLVGVVAADIGLFLPDFRSSERTFQLLTQVAGRAGRSERGGRVIIQTYHPEHYVVQAAAQHNYADFYAREMQFRRAHAYPPVRRLARLILWEKQPDAARREAEHMAAKLRHRIAQMGLEGEGIVLIGPAPAFFDRYRGYYRWQILVRAREPAALLRGLDIPFGWRVDIDPVSLL